jgi:hypothetical protein
MRGCGLTIGKIPECSLGCRRIRLLAFDPASPRKLAFARALILRAGHSSNNRTRWTSICAGLSQLNMIEGSAQVLEDYLVIAKQFETKCVASAQQEKMAVACRADSPSPER